MMITNVAGLMSFPAKGRPGLLLTEMNLVKGHGVKSDRHKGGKRQVSLLSAQVQRWRNKENVNGLCLKRFKANILIDAMPDNMKGGTILLIGDTVLKVNDEGKECFDECELYAANTPCRLSENAVFASVERGGTIKLGDSVIIE